MTQYSKRMVIVHWLTFILVITAWFLGDSLAEATDVSKATLSGYLLHMSIGGAILLLTLAQMVFRSKDGTPPMLADKPMFQKLAKAVHHSLNTVLILLPLTGIITVITSDAGSALLAGNANLLPKEDGFKDVFANGVHEILVNALIALVVLHIIGALKHQFIDKDSLIRRMSWCKKG